jgi:hypothetical protein
VVSKLELAERVALAGALGSLFELEMPLGFGFCDSPRDDVNKSSKVVRVKRSSKYCRPHSPGC